MRFDFVTSDTHFGHLRILELCDRPFDSVDEMDAALIDAWNSVVGPDDVVVHLGDLALGTIAESLPSTASLNGRRYLIPGNHDRVSSTYDRGRQLERFTPLYEAAGWTVLPEQVTAEVGGSEVLLSHFPYEGDSHGEDRHVDARPADTGLPLIHGHVHEEWAERGRMFNAGVDVRGYAPVPVAAVEQWLATV